VKPFLAWLDLTGVDDPQFGRKPFCWLPRRQAALYGLLNRLRDLGLDPDFCGQSACPKS